MKYFWKKILDHELFRSMGSIILVSWATKFFLKNLYNPPAPPPTYLMYAPLLYRLMDWFLYDTDIRHERYKTLFTHHTPKACSYMS